MANIFHVIKDPVYGSMQFSTEENGWIKPFIDSENFQRLRHIKQLGLTDWIFPGAVHSRFSHNLGCCYVACQICNKLNINGEKKQMVVIACLLHDIGHGPFSHAFEDIFYKRCIQHEMWTPMFLQEFADEEFIETFNKQNKKFPLSAKKLSTIQDLIMHQYNEDKLLADIVSSQLDADRLDYLLRDSHFCGVTYGKYDFHWLLNCLSAIKKDGKSRLGITRKGIGVVEEYLMARRLMMRNVYQHGKKYGAEFLLERFLKYLVQGIDEEDQFKALYSNTLVQFLQAVNQFNHQATNAEDLNKLKQRFVKQSYHLYKQLCDYDVILLIRNLSHWKGNHAAIEIARRLQIRQLPKTFFIDVSKMNAANELIRHFKAQNKDQVQDWQITLLQSPHLSYEMSQDPILVEDFSGLAKYLHEDSFMINAMSDRYENACLLSIDEAIIDRPKVSGLIDDIQRK